MLTFDINYNRPMPKRPLTKDCIDIRICIDEATNNEIRKYQATRMAKDGIYYPKGEAASDLFMKLVQTKPK